MTRESTLTPFEIQDARRAARLASELQEQVEQDLRANTDALAEAERAYRMARSEEMARLRRQEDKPSWSACETLALGAKHVADLRYTRDVCEGMVKATEQAAYRRGADRRSLETLSVWSQRKDLRDDHEGQREPSQARRAAA